MLIFSIDSFVGCKPENDTEWEIFWPATNKGDTAIQSCPGGAESVGMYICVYEVNNSVRMQYI